ncbi:MAG: aminotransferase class I/II-fold pyridoxal phosphate-dependent enzyme, partial [Butyricicoccus sp.]
YFRDTCAKIIATRARSTEALRALGFTVLDSASNFVLATHSKMPAKEIFEALKARKIFVRYFNLPRVNNHLRITIGTDAEMDALFAALKEILA